MRKSTMAMPSFKRFSALTVLFGCGLLSGCSTLPHDIVNSAVDGAQRAVEKCNQPEILSVSSTASIREELEQNLSANFGLANANGVGNNISIPATITDIRAQLALLRQEDQKTLVDVIASLAKLRSDAQSMQTSLTGMFTGWKQQYQGQCQQANLSLDCYFDTTNFAVNAATVMQGDAVDLKTDTDIFRAVATAALNKIANPNADIHIVTIRKDLDALQTEVDQVAVMIDMIIHPSEKAGDAQMAEAIRDSLAVYVDKLVAYESAIFAMNQLDRVGRKVEVKLDEIDQKSWFLLSLLGVGGTSLIIEGQDRDSMSKISPIIVQYDSTTRKITAVSSNASVSPKGILLNTQYLAEAAAAYACNKLAIDSSTLPSDTARAEVLLYPIYIELIEAAVSHSAVAAHAVTPAIGVIAPIVSPVPSTPAPMMIGAAAPLRLGSARPVSRKLSVPEHQTAVGVVQSNNTTAASVNHMDSLRAALQLRANNVVAATKNAQTP